MSGCEHKMLSGPRKGEFCGRSGDWSSELERPTCYHHTPERLFSQAGVQKRRLSNMTPCQRLEENKVRRERAKKIREEEYRSDSDSGSSGYES